LNFKWNLRQMLLWVFIVGLILPYIVAMIPPKLNPLKGFSVSEWDLQTWLREVDPTVEIHSSGGSVGSNDSVESDYDYFVEMKNATDIDLFEHLQTRLQEKLDRGLWMITESGSSNESFSFVFSNGFSQYRLYVWNVPPSEAECEFARASISRSMRIKVLTIGYTSR
jgi:hypothetical protein